MSKLILACPRKIINMDLLPEYGYVSIPVKVMIEYLANLQFQFLPRQEIETDPSFKQPIPYIVLNHQNQILFFKRNSSEERLKELYSIGIGGHIEPVDEDNDIWGTIINGAIREVTEETGLKPSKEELHFLGLINEEKSKVGHVHWGFVFVLNVKDRTYIKFMDEIQSPQWIRPENIMTLNPPMEYWSKITLELLLKSKNINQ
ncbi:MAG: NUDIX domain-containing protein [Methanobacteriota archaeon]|nr:MAG: NUDIX domain-containing protein [Euryarchaeota archaeon]